MVRREKKKDKKKGKKNTFFFESVLVLVLPQPYQFRLKDLRRGKVFSQRLFAANECNDVPQIPWEPYEFLSGGIKVLYCQIYLTG